MQKVQHKVQTSVQYQKQDKPHLEAPFIMMGHLYWWCIRRKNHWDEFSSVGTNFLLIFHQIQQSCLDRQYRWMITHKYSESNWHIFAGPQVLDKECAIKYLKCNIWFHMTRLNSEKIQIQHQENCVAVALNMLCTRAKSTYQSTKPHTGQIKRRRGRRQKSLI